MENTDNENLKKKTIYMAKPEDLVLIGRDTDDGQDHPRYDVRVHNEPRENIVLSMMEVGVKTPIQVSPNGDKLEVVNGRQRVINAREANKRLLEQGGSPLRIPIMPPERGTDREIFRITVICNEQKIDDSPVGKGTKAQKALNYGYTEEEVAQHFDVSVVTLKKYLSTLDLLPEIQKMIVEGTLSATKGYELAVRTKKQQQKFLERLKKGNRSGKHLRRAPPKRFLRRVIEVEEAKEKPSIPKSFLLGLKYACGQLDANEVRGLEKVIEEMEGPAPKTREVDVEWKVVWPNGDTELLTAEEYTRADADIKKLAVKVA